MQYVLEHGIFKSLGYPFLLLNGSNLFVECFGLLIRKMVFVRDFCARNMSGTTLSLIPPFPYHLLLISSSSSLDS